MSEALDFILFVDDTNIFFSDKDRNQANKLSIDIKKIKFYFIENKTKQLAFFN